MVNFICMTSGVPGPLNFNCAAPMNYKFYQVSRITNENSLVIRSKHMTTKQIRGQYVQVEVLDEIKRSGLQLEMIVRRSDSQDRCPRLFIWIVEDVFSLLEQLSFNSILALRKSMFISQLSSLQNSHYRLHDVGEDDTDYDEDEIIFFNYLNNFTKLKNIHVCGTTTFRYMYSRGQKCSDFHKIFEIVCISLVLSSCTDNKNNFILLTPYTPSLSLKYSTCSKLYLLVGCEASETSWWNTGCQILAGTS